MKYKKQHLGKKFYISYIKYIGVSGVFVILLGILLLMLGLLLIDPYQIKLQYRLGMVCTIFGVMIWSLIACSISMYEIKYKKNNILNHYYLADVDLTKPYKIVYGAIGVGKTTYIDIMKEYDNKMQYIEVITYLELPVGVRVNAEEIIHIERFKPNDFKPNDIHMRKNAKDM